MVGVTPGACGRWLVDEVPGTLFAVLARSFEEGTIADATPLCATARRLKTADEVACIAHAQAVTESAMVAVHRLVSSGRRGSELSATLLAEALSNGAEACVVDPIWQVMSPSAADGPRTLSGGPAFPLAATGDRALAEGDVIWNDTGFSFGGYHSDFGRTWIVDARPGARQRDQFRRWRDVVAAASAQLRPGSSAHDVTEAADEVGAAGAGSRPWLEHLYLGHGIGMDSAETPLIGTDLGSDFDRRIEIEAGMVVVLEPAIWDEGAGGFRGEEIFAVQPEGDPLRLSHFHYEPFE